MSWYGKIIGGTLGALFGPAGIIAGTSCGHYFDSKREYASPSHPPGKREPVPMAREERSRILFHNTFAMLAKVSKADGAVCQENVDTIEKFMRKSSFSTASPVGEPHASLISQKKALMVSVSCPVSFLELFNTTLTV